jgi:hypothetical protein
MTRRWSRNRRILRTLELLEDRTLCSVSSWGGSLEHGPANLLNTQVLTNASGPSLGTEARTAATTVVAPKITSITGYSDGVGVTSGRWTGQPSVAPKNASNRYKGFLASDSYNYGSASSNPYYWDINGSNFGTAKGTVSVGSQFSVTVVSWSATQIRIKAVASTSFQSAAVTVKITTSDGKASATFNDNVVGIIKSRGFGQCTWFVAQQRLANGLSVPPSAYSTTASIPAVGALDSGYRPAQWDALNYSGNHVSIITSTVTETTNKDKSITYSFTVSEYNADWQESLSSSTRTYKLSAPNSAGRRTVLGGIGTNASSNWVATGYYR